MMENENPIWIQFLILLEDGTVADWKEFHKENLFTYKWTFYCPGFYLN